MRLRILVRAIFTSATALAALLALQTASAIGDGLEKDLAPQALDRALEVFAADTGLQLVYRADLASGLTSRGARAGQSAEETLRELLRETGLTFEFLNSRTVAIHAGDVTGSSSIEFSPLLGPGEGGTAERGMRLAQAEPSKDESSKEEPSTATAGQELPAPEETGKAIPEILVRGSKSLNADIRRTEDDPQPYVVFGQEDIARSQASTLQDFLKTRLPMNALQTSNNQLPGNAAGNLGAIDLRGLGTNQTLVLVDGRRLPGVNISGGDQSQPDINGVPLGVIERIEILPSTASGIYGGGATGGVINIITRQDYSGVLLSVTGGATFRGEAAEGRIDFSGGTSFENGRTHLRFAASYSDSDGLLESDRSFARRARQLQLVNNPAAFYSASTPPVGHTPNIRSANGSNLVLDNGTTLNSPITFVPLGYAGPATDNGTALVANAGQYNIEPPNDLNGSELSLLQRPRVSSASLNLRRDFTSSVEGFLDLSWFENRTEANFGAVPTVVTLPANAPNNPFTTSIRIRYPTPNLNSNLTAQSEGLRANLGAIVRLPFDWSAILEHGWSRSSAGSQYANALLGDPDGAGPGVSFNTAVANSTLDVVRDLNAFSLNYSPYLLPVPNSLFGPAETILNDTTLRFSGPLFDLPGGPLTLTGLVEHREEEARATFLELSAFNFIQYIPARTQTVTSYYAEARAPILSGSAPFGNRLEIQASVRRDNYETTAADPNFITVASRSGPFPAIDHVTNEVAATKYTVGILYSPIPDLLFRTSVGTGFLPPSLSQIVPAPPFVNNATFIDPKRGNVATVFPNVSLLTGGSPNLRPEESESFSIGAVFTPRMLPGFRLSIDYTSIDKTDEIASLDSQSIVNLEDAFPGRVTRDPLTPADAALGYTGGVITAVDSSSINIAAARVETYDIQADYAIHTQRFGEFNLFAIAAYEPTLERQALPTLPFVNSAGFSNGPLNWRGNVGISWDQGPWTIGWNAQYYDSYRVYAGGSSPAAIATAALNQGSDTIPSQIYHDFFARVRFGELQSLASGKLSNVELSFGISNAFDEEPPLLATTLAQRGYSLYGDPRLRRCSLSIRAAF